MVKDKDLLKKIRAAANEPEPEAADDTDAPADDTGDAAAPLTPGKISQDDIDRINSIFAKLSPDTQAELHKLMDGYVPKNKSKLSEALLMSRPERKKPSTNEALEAECEDRWMTLAGLK